MPILFGEEGGLLAAATDPPLTKARDGTRRRVASAVVQASHGSIIGVVSRAFHGIHCAGRDRMVGGFLAGRSPRRVRLELRAIVQPDAGARYLYRLRDLPAESCSDSRPVDSLPSTKTSRIPAISRPLERHRHQAVGASRAISERAFRRFRVPAGCSLRGSEFPDCGCRLCRLRNGKSAAEAVGGSNADTAIWL